MKLSTAILPGMAGIVLLAGCATPPVGPSVAVMPAANKSFEVFQQDETVCTQYARQQIGGEAQAVNNQAFGGALLGTVLGAGLGAAVGGGSGAAIGAASGALVGTGVGASASAGSQWGIQRNYDIAYAQCMTAHGNKVPPIPASAPVASYPYAYPYAPYPYYPYGYSYGYPGYYYGPSYGLSFGFGGGRHWR